MGSSAGSDDGKIPRSNIRLGSIGCTAEEVPTHRPEHPGLGYAVGKTWNSLGCQGYTVVTSSGLSPEY